MEGTQQERIVYMVRLLAQAQGIKTAELARRLGMSRTALYERFNGNTQITVNNLETFAAALNVGPADLLREPGEVLNMLSDQGLLRLRGNDIFARQLLLDLAA